jgi:hypothetical protein
MLVLRHGKVIEQRALRAAAGGGSRVRIGLARETTELRATLAAIDGVRVESVDGRRAVVHLAGGADAHAALLAQLVGRGLPVVEFGAEREDLQASYLRTVQHGGNA